VAVGVPFTSTITRRSYTDIELYPGKEVYITFKAADAHLFDL